VSMDAPLSPNDESNLYDVLLNADALSPEDNLMKTSLDLEIERALKHIGEREAEIIRLFYGLHGITPHSLDEIGEKFNLTRERVRQIKEKSIQKLKSTTRNRILRNYLG
ncbi:MAG: sigma-70 family RNA polymerase sigma factor, partial [Bacteroidales bacterium]